MRYLLGARLLDTAKVRFELTKIYGIGTSKACQICDQLGLGANITIDQLTRSQFAKINSIITQTHLVDYELKKIVLNDKKRLLQISCYRGLRHNAGLPLRGQRTHTNAKTMRRLRRSIVLQGAVVKKTASRESTGRRFFGNY